jgi:hypothetical protein
MSAGDPFRFRLPKIGLKKSTLRRLGKSLGSVARAGVGFIPGVGPIASQLLSGGGGGGGGGEQPYYGPSTAPEPAPEDVGTDVSDYEAQFLDFARAYGLIAGDPGPRPVPRATATHSTKAGRRVPPPRGPGKFQGSSARGKPGSTGGGSFAQQHPGLLGLGQGLAGGIPILGGLASAGLGQLAGMGAHPAVAAAMGMHKRHRAMNPANIKALRRSMRRVEGFEKVVKRVEKMFPRLKHAMHGGVRVHHSSHRAGCKCATCKRAA